MAGLDPPPLVGEVHVWFTNTGHVAPMLADRYHDVLSSGELDRNARFHRPEDRLQHLVAHALKRITLSRYSATAPALWRFVTNRYGRPDIAEPDTDLTFNLSHTSGLVACAVSRTPALGVDVEHINRRTAFMEIAQDVFAPVELEALGRCATAEQRPLFFQLWTLKEAYIKGRGMGLSLPLDKFWFELDDQAIRFTVDPGLEDEASEWRFLSTQISRQYQLAVAVRAPKSTPVRLFETIPLGVVPPGSHR